MSQRHPKVVRGLSWSERRTLVGFTALGLALSACAGGAGSTDDDGAAGSDSPGGGAVAEGTPEDGTSGPASDPATGEPASMSGAALPGVAPAGAAAPDSDPAAGTVADDGQAPGTDGSGADAPATPVTPGTPAPAVDCGAQDVSPNVLRRLSRLELQLTWKELFQLSTVPELASIPEDSDFKGFRTLSALQAVTTEHLRAYQQEATALATSLLADSERANSVIGCDVAAADCLPSFISEFGRVAYRRALAAEEVSALLEVASQTGGTPNEQFTAVVAAMLSSASFLFRHEIGDSPEGLSTLSGEELAAKLSFTLLGRGPSGALLDRGAAGELDSESGLTSAVAELLADERSQEYFAQFFKQWLGFEKLRAPNEPKPGWNDALMLSMSEETDHFLGEYAWGEGVHFLDALTANHTYIRADLAEFYGLPAPAESGRVEFPAGHDREGSGLFTHAALISAKGDGDRIAHRGAWVQKVFFCVELAVPTALLDSLSDELEGLTYPQMLDKRNTEAACAGCHALLDPIGVGFSAYDAAGQFDPSVDVNQYGIVPALPGGETFTRIGELAAQVRARAEVASCLTDRLFLYTGGREATANDECLVASATERFATDQGRFASILEGLVLAPEFRLRRAPEPEAN